MNAALTSSFTRATAATTLLRAQVQQHLGQPQHLLARPGRGQPGVARREHDAARETGSGIDLVGVERAVAEAHRREQRAVGAVPAVCTDVHQVARDERLAGRRGRGVGPAEGPGPRPEPLHRGGLGLRQPQVGARDRPPPGDAAGRGDPGPAARPRRSASPRWAGPTRLGSSPHGRSIRSPLQESTRRRSRQPEGPQHGRVQAGQPQVQAAAYGGPQQLGQGRHRPARPGRPAPG